MVQQEAASKMKVLTKALSDLFSRSAEGSNSCTWNTKSSTLWLLKMGVALLTPLFLSSFFFFSKPTHWSYQETNSGNSKSRLVQYEPKNKLEGLGVSFLQINGEIQTSLSLFHRSYDSIYHGRYVPVELVTEQKIIKGEALCLAGGQKLLLNSEMQKTLFDSLTQDQPVTIRLGENQSTLFPSSFQKHMKKLLS
jgi:hypothetical protein